MTHYSTGRSLFTLTHPEHIKMRSNIQLSKLACRRFIGARATAASLRENVELNLARGNEVVFDFSGIEVTQSFVDELIGALILRRGPDVLARLVFKSCSDDVRSVIEFVATDRCDQYIKANTH